MCPGIVFPDLRRVDRLVHRILLGYGLFHASIFLVGIEFTEEVLDVLKILELRRDVVSFGNQRAYATILAVVHGRR